MKIPLQLPMSSTMRHEAASTQNATFVYIYSLGSGEDTRPERIRREYDIEPHELNRPRNDNTTM